MKRYVAWNEVGQFIHAVGDNCDVTNLDGVYALPRGGLVLAVMISHRYNIPLLLAPTTNSLIIDDICDSGESLLHYFKNSSSEDQTARPVIMTMFAKKNNLVTPDYYLFEKEYDWIVFPWEE